MKRFHGSLLLSLVSYVIGGVFRRSGFLAGEISGAGRVAVISLMLLPAGIGIGLGLLSLRHREAKPWWAMGAIVLNLAMLLTGFLLLFPG